MGEMGCLGGEIKYRFSSESLSRAASKLLSLKETKHECR